MRPYRESRAISVTLATFVVAATVIGASSTALAQDGDEQRQKGRTLLENHCGDCHATGETGESKHRLAPPFRTLGQRYAIESLEEALAEGIVSGHPDMPEFKFEAAEVGAIIAYLKSLPVTSR